MERVFSGGLGLRHVDQAAAHLVHGDRPVGGRRSHRVSETLEVRAQSQRVLRRSRQRETALLSRNRITAQDK